MTGWIIAISMMLLFFVIKNWGFLQRKVDNIVRGGDYFTIKRIEQAGSVDELLDLKGELGKRYKKKIDKRLDEFKL